MSDTKQFQSSFWSFNFAFGVTSFFAILFGSVGIYGALGTRILRSAGVKVPVATETMEVVGAVSYVGTIAGFAGFGSAIAVAYVGGTIAAKREYKRHLVEQSYRKQDKASFTPPTRIKSVGRIEASNTVRDLQQVNIYYLTKNEQIGGNKLIVLGNVFSKMPFIGYVSNEQVAILMEIFGCDSDELLGKAFSSFHTRPDEALKDYLARQGELIACLRLGFERADIDKCAGCVNLRVKGGAVCPIHKEGWYRSGRCPDKQMIPSYPMAPYEDEQAFGEYNQQIQKSNAFIFKNDDGTISLIDEVTNRHFQFDWFGDRKLVSDKLTELPIGAGLESYLQYYSNRDANQFEDYSFRVAELGIKVKGVAKVEICSRNFDISVTLFTNKELGIDYELCYKFNRYGFPKYSHETKSPVGLKGKYNLVNFIDYVRYMPPTNCNTPFWQRS